MIPLPNDVESIMAGQTGATPPNTTGVDDVEAPNATPDGSPSAAPGSLAWKLAMATGRPSTPSPAPSNPSTGSDDNVASRIAKNAGKLDPSGVGGWARTLVAGAQSALAGLGDAAHATDNLKPGQGALAGFVNTINARNERLERQKQQEFENNLKLSREQREAKNDEVTRAHTAAQTAQVQQIAAKLDYDLRREHISDGKNAADAFRKNHTVQDNINEKGLTDMLKSYQANPQAGPDGKPVRFYDLYSVFQTGEQEVEDANGKKSYQPIYSIVTKSPVPVEVDQQTHDFLTKYLPTGDVPPVGTKMNGDLFDSQFTRAQIAANGIRAIEKFNDEEFDAKKKRQLAADMEVAGHFAAKYTDDPFKGLEEGLRNEEVHRQQAQAQLAAAQKSGDQAGIQRAQGFLEQIANERKSLENVINNGFTETQREKHREAVEKAKLKAQEQSDSHSELTASRLVDAFEDPTQLSKRAKTYNQQLDDADKYSMQKYGTHYDVAKRQEQYNYAKNPKQQDFIKLIKGVTEPGGALDVAMNAAKDLPNVTDSQTLNNIFSAFSGEFNNKAVTDFHTSMLGLADEYAKIMGGGTGNLGQFEHAMTILKEGYAKKNMQSAANVLRRDIAARFRGVVGNNVYLLREYGTPEQVDAALRGKDPWAGFAQQQFAPKYSVNDIIKQNGRQYKVTAVDANGKVTSAQPVQ